MLSGLRNLYRPGCKDFSCGYLGSLSSLGSCIVRLVRTPWRRAAGCCVRSRIVLPVKAGGGRCQTLQGHLSQRPALLPTHLRWYPSRKYYFYRAALNNTTLFAHDSAAERKVKLSVVWVSPPLLGSQTAFSLCPLVTFIVGASW